MRAKLIFRWYDLWVGLFIDTKKRVIYFFPFPMLGIMVTLKAPNEVSAKIRELKNYKWNKEDSHAT